MEKVEEEDGSYDMTINLATLPCFMAKSYINFFYQVLGIGIQPHK